MSSSFGFGPVSKAVTIANELARRSTDLQLDFFGNGVDMEFARKSGLFHSFIETDVDNREALHCLLPLLRHYDVIVAVLTLDILPLWKKGKTKLFFVDSLAWMWSKAPVGIENADIYFIQDYLFTNSDYTNWTTSKSISSILVAPIESTKHLKTPAIVENRLLLNFSGCMNPFVNKSFYKEYVNVLSEIVIACSSNKFESILICCNSHLSDYLSRKFCNWKHVSVSHLANELFLDRLASSAKILTAPGITTTLEAIKLNRPVKYILPQNYSQYLISEQYKKILHPGSSMPFSVFGDEFTIPPDLEESKGVELVLTHLHTILRMQKTKIRDIITEFLEEDNDVNLALLSDNILHKWQVTGQEMIANYCIA